MSATICDGCAQPFDRPLPVCRSVSCRAAACRFCRDAETGQCLACVREQASLAAYRTAREARDRDELIAILLGGARVDELLLPLASAPIRPAPDEAANAVTEGPGPAAVHPEVRAGACELWHLTTWRHLAEGAALFAGLALLACGVML